MTEILKCQKCGHEILLWENNLRENDSSKCPICDSKELKTIKLPTIKLP